MDYPVVSAIQLQPLLQRNAPKQETVNISLDLGLSHSEVHLTTEGVRLPNNTLLPWQEVKRVVKHPNRCYKILNGIAEPIVVYSEKTGWVRTLFPTRSAPTTLVSGILMHRIKNTDPIKDTAAKIATLGRLKHVSVFDTATGLGYTAIAAAQAGAIVTTVEYDPAALTIAKENPWSAPLFLLPNITQIIDDSKTAVKKQPNQHFQRIIHDPPTFKLAGDLYAETFYQELYRILTPQGVLFHYIGDPNSTHGSMITKGVMHRLRTAGFQAITPAPKAFGVIARK